MLLLAVLSAMFLARFLLIRVLPWRLASVSTLNFVGVLVFVVTGVAADENYPALFKFGLMVGFYGSVLTGELLAAKIRTPSSLLPNLQRLLLNSKPAGLIAFAAFAVTALLPGLGLIWSDANYVITSNADVQQLMSLRGQSAVQDVGLSEGIEGLLRSVFLQVSTIALVGLGVGVRLFPKSTLIVLVLASGIAYSTSAYGARSGFAIAMATLLLVYYFTARRKRIALCVLGAGALVILFLLEQRLHVRSGSEVRGTPAERIEMLLATDFAYGGMALDCLQHSASFDSGARYLIGHAALLVPRFLWPDKPYVATNQEMTTFYLGSGADHIVLFTPLGEGLFYFGLLGVALIGLAYGGTTAYLEGLYRTNLILLGFMVEVYVWTFLGYRHTFNNIFLALVLPKVYPMICLIVLDRSILRSREDVAPRGRQLRRPATS